MEDLPTIIVEFGQQRQRLKLDKDFFTIKQLLDLFSTNFQREINLDGFDITFLNGKLNDKTTIDFCHFENYQRFTIQSKIVKNQHDEIIALKQRLNTASVEAMEIAFLIKSIHANSQNLFQKLTSNNNQSLLSISPSTDEGIVRDTETSSIFESACSRTPSESNYVECRDDLTMINQKHQLEWRNPVQQNRSAHWNYKKPTKNFANNKSQLKKPINPNKPPLPQEKKKNIPCKYAAGGNCKRGSQCRFIHVV